MDRLAQTEGLLATLIAFPTISSDSNLDLINWAANHLDGLGARLDVQSSPDGSKANLFATFGPEGDGGLILSGHSDVVPVADQDWTSDPFAMVARDDRLFGRGTCDMKGFIACVLALVPEMSRWPLARPLHVALTYDEETGCLGAKTLAADLHKRDLRPAMAIIGEPTCMQVIDGHKGCYEYTTHITGLEGHGSAPDLGVNAAVIAARYAMRLMELEGELRRRAPADSPYEPPWSTINIGKIAGGVAHNVIPGLAEVEWDLRPVNTEDADFVLDQVDRYAEGLLPAMRAIDPSATILRETIGETIGLSRATRNEAARIATALTGANGTGTVPFGTEAGLYQQLGIDCVVCGPGSIEQAHKPDEFIARDQLAACLTMLEGLKPYLC